MKMYFTVMVANYERIKSEPTQRSRCNCCSCMSLGDDFPCDVMSCEMIMYLN